MTDDRENAVRRRRLLRGLGATGVAVALAGCSGGGSGDQSGTSSDGADGADGGASTTSAESTATSATASMETTDGASSSDATSNDSPSTTVDDEDGGGLSKNDDESTTRGDIGGDDGPVAATVRLTIPAAKSNVEKFETLRATFERFELTASDGSTVTLDDETRDVDLADVGAGGTVELFETEIPAGAYEKGTLYLPISEAVRADGSDPEFQDTVPTSRTVRGDAIEVGGDAIAFDVRVGLVRVGGDGPWTYTLGWGVGPA